MPIGAKRSPEDELQDWARLQVRAGFLDEGRMRAEVVSAIEAEMPGLDAGVLARAWLAGAAADSRPAPAASSCKIRSAHFSPMTMVGMLLLPLMMTGMMEASATRRPATPRTRRRSGWAWHRTATN